MKIGALIPIRLSSERLPGKAMMPILGRPAVYYLLDRVCASRHLEAKRVVVCTTHDASDDPLAVAVEAYGCSVFRGSRDDIIKRFHDAMVQYDFDAVVQIDGDDILSDTLYMDLTMDRLVADPGLDVVTCDGLPLGIAVKSFTRSAMIRVYEIYNTERNDTGFIYFFTRTGLFRQEVVKPASTDHVLDDARLTLDYAEDLEVFRRIIGALYQPGSPPAPLEAIIGFLQQNPAVRRHNLHLNETYWQRTAEKVKLQFRCPDGDIRSIEF